MVFSRGLVISLGVSALSATLLFLYFRNRMASVERKVDVMFDLIQSHETDRQQAHQMMMMRQQQQNQAPVQETGAWVTEENTRPERNLIDVSDDEDEEYDSEDSREVSDNEDDLEERIKLVTTDIDIEEADEAKDVEVLETTNTEAVNVDETIELQEVTDDLEEEASSGDVDNTLHSANKSDDVDVDVNDSLEDDDSDEDEEEDTNVTPNKDVAEEVEYSKLKVAELKAIAEAKGLTNYKSLKKQPLIDLIKASE